MEIRLEVAFQEAMEEINDLSRRLIFERSIRKQLEKEVERLSKEIEDLKQEK